MKKPLASICLFCMLLVSADSFGQAIVTQFIYDSRSGNTPLTDGCQGGAPFSDGHSVGIYWDRTFNGPDSSDQLIPLGIQNGEGDLYAFPFTGETDGLGEGYFYSPLLNIPEPPTVGTGGRPAYFVKVSGESCCWVSESHLFGTGYSERILMADDWTCSEQPCLTGELPDAPLSVTATDNEYCFYTNVRWSYAGQNYSGFCVYVDDVLKTFVRTTIDSTMIRLLDLNAHSVSVTAINERGQSEPVSDQGSAYLRRFVPGPNGDVAGIKDPGEQITLEVDIPFGSCPAATWLYLMVNDTLHSELVAYNEPATAFLNNLTCTLPSPTQLLENCRIMLRDSSWDYRVQFFDTTVSIFSITGQDAGEDDSYHAASFALLPAYPNPFNSTISIPFAISKESHVSLEIVNLTGQVVAELANRTFTAGTHTLTWQGQSADGRTLASGIYFCRLNSGHLTDARKIILLK